MNGDATTLIELKAAVEKAQQELVEEWDGQHEIPE